MAETSYAAKLMSDAFVPACDKKPYDEPVVELPEIAAVQLPELPDA